MRGRQGCSPVLADSGRYVAERIREAPTGRYFMPCSGNMVTDDAGTPICLTASIADITGPEAGQGGYTGP